MQVRRHCSLTRAITEPPRPPNCCTTLEPVKTPPAVRPGCVASGAPAVAGSLQSPGQGTPAAAQPRHRPPSPACIPRSGSRATGGAGRPGGGRAQPVPRPGRAPGDPRRGREPRPAGLRREAPGGRPVRPRSLPRAPVAAHLGVKAPRCRSVPLAPHVPPGGAARTRTGRPAGPSSRPPEPRARSTPPPWRSAPSRPRACGAETAQGPS